MFYIAIVHWKCKEKKLQDCWFVVVFFSSYPTQLNWSIRRFDLFFGVYMWSKIKYTKCNERKKLKEMSCARSHFHLFRDFIYFCAYCTTVHISLTFIFSINRRRKIKCSRWRRKHHQHIHRTNSTFIKYNRKKKYQNKTYPRFYASRLQPLINTKPRRAKYTIKIISL